MPRAAPADAAAALAEMATLYPKLQAARRAFRASPTYGRALDVQRFTRRIQALRDGLPKLVLVKSEGT